MSITTILNFEYEDFANNNNHIIYFSNELELLHYASAANVIYDDENNTITCTGFADLESGFAEMAIKEIKHAKNVLELPFLRGRIEIEQYRQDVTNAAIYFQQ